MAFSSLHSIVPQPPLSSSKIFSSPQIKPISLTSHSLSPLLVIVVGGLVIKLCLTLAIPWTVARQAPLSMEFPRQEYWNGLPFPSPGDLPDPGIKLGSSSLQADSARSPMNMSSVQFSSVAQSCLTLQPHELQHARPPCPSPTPGVHSDSRPSSRWCHPAISSSAVPFSSCLQSLPASVFSNESTLRMRWPKYWSFSLNMSSTG